LTNTNWTEGGGKLIIDIVLVYAAGRGGLEDVITSVSKELVNRGHKVRVFQSHPSTNLEWDKGLPEIFYYGEKDNYASENLYTLSKGYANSLEKYGKPDVILATHAPSLSFICRSAIATAKGKIPPVISWLHGEPSYYGNEELLKYSDAHLAISTKIGKDILQNSFDDTPVYNIGNPMHFDDIVRINRSKDVMKFIYIGRFDLHQKRQDVLFKGLKDLDFEWKLICIGDGHDQKEIKQMSIEMGIEKNIEWIGWKEDPWAYVSEASALILTSDYEGFGLVLVESLARGIPVISTSCSGPLDIVSDGINGWLFPVGDSVGLNKIINDINSGEKKLPSPEICENSVEKFHYKNVIDKLEVILEYHRRLEDGGEPSSGISNYLTKDDLFTRLEITSKILSTTIRGIEYLGSSNQYVNRKVLQESFSERFLEQIFDEQQPTEETKIKATVCYPKIEKMNYKLTKAGVRFTLINEGIDNGEKISEKLNCEVRLSNQGGNWLIDRLQILGSQCELENKQLPITPINDYKRKILLVSENNSGSNTFAINKMIPQNIREKYEVEFVKQELTQSYINKVRSADILITTHANILENKNEYNPNQIIFDLWHGFPLKTMGFADNNEPNKNLMGERWSNIDYLSSYSSLYSDYMHQCFKVDKSKFFITGSPRNDLLLESYWKEKREINSSLSKLFESDLGTSKVIFYMPTYRNLHYNDRADTNLVRNNIFGLNGFNSEQFELFLEENSLVLILKLHPSEEKLYLNKFEQNKRIYVLTDEMLMKNNIDSYEILGYTDMLITDYSSVYFDYLLTNNPIIFLPIDKEEYEQRRGFIVNSYNEWTPGPKVNNQLDLQKSIEQFLNNKNLYSKEREKIKNIVHEYQDNLSSERVWNFVDNTVDKELGIIK